MLAHNRVENFWDWFDKMRGDLTIRQVEERAGVPRSRIGNPYSAKRKPTELICLSIAKGLGLNVDKVLYQAGFSDTPPLEDGNIDPSQGSGAFLEAIFNMMNLSGFSPFSVEMGKYIKQEPLPKKFDVVLPDMEARKILTLFLQLKRQKQLSALDYVTWLHHLQTQEEKQQEAVQKINELMQGEFNKTSTSETPESSSSDVESPE